MFLRVCTTWPSMIYFIMPSWNKNIFWYLKKTTKKKNRQCQVLQVCAKGLKRGRSDSDGRKKESAKVNFFVLEKFGLCPIWMNEPCPSRSPSVMSFLVALALFCPFLFGIMTGVRQGTESSSLTDKNCRKIAFTALPRWMLWDAKLAIWFGFYCVFILFPRVDCFVWRLNVTLRNTHGQ